MTSRAGHLVPTACCHPGWSRPYYLPLAAPDRRFLPVWPQARGVG
ncbi:hypothetical protein HMPREF9056_00074 [Actinomyces sp. oral taxon 170 str. F0386]|nr:hypothetical protein HMPREF9056_00074 [Actinomyces sp. oral taxon 170 str. F0386]